MFLKNIQYRVLLEVTHLLRIFWRSTKLVSAFVRSRILKVWINQLILLVMYDRKLIFGRKIEIKYLFLYFFWLFAPLSLFLIFSPFRIDDKLEELGNFLVFTLVIKDHFQKLRKLNFSRLIFVNWINKLFNFFSRFHKSYADEKFFELVDCYWTGFAVVHGVETFFHLFSLIVIKINKILFALFG